MSDTRNAGAKAQTDMVETLNFEPIKGYPMLQWRGKRPFTSTHFYPAQLKEQHGSDVDGWLNKIYWGDNLQVMSHLLKNYRGKVDLVYIDPPFDSKADYKLKVQLRGKSVENDRTTFEEKQYTDIWTNDEYLQFMYERLVIIKELMSKDASLLLHCDDEKNYLLRMIVEEVFGSSNFRNEIIWKRSTSTGLSMKRCGTLHDTIYWFTKSDTYKFFMQYHAHDAEYLKRARKDENGRMFIPIPTGNPGLRPNLYYNYKGFLPHPNGYKWKRERMEEYDRQGRLLFPENPDGRIQFKQYLDEVPGVKLQDLWLDIPAVNPVAKERNGYPTQKPEALLDRLIKMTTAPGDLVFDCFMGSGTTQAVAMKLGRRFLGADINLGAIQTATKRFISVAEDIQSELKAQANKAVPPPTLALDDEVVSTVIDEDEEDEVPPVKIQEPTVFYTGFEVYNVNNYEIFRNAVEAKDLLIEALELQKLQAGHLFDGERDGRMWKVMPVNKIATRQDLNEIITGLNLRALADRLNATPNQPAEKITLVCMGHEPDLAATLNQEVALSLNVKAGAKMPLDVQVFDVLRDRGDLQFKRDSEAKISVQGQQLVIEAFYPMNLLAKLSLEKEKVENWREMVDSVMVDFNYDGAVFNPAVLDIPEKNALVAGSYPIPDDAGTIRVKITDVLSESLEVEVQG